MSTEIDPRMFDSVGALLDEHKDLQVQLAQPETHADQSLARRLGRRYAQLNGVVEAYRHWTQLKEDREAAEELADDDAEFAAEVPQLKEDLHAAAERLLRMLIPRDEHDVRNVILEIKGGAGGDEAALFAG